MTPLTTSFGNGDVLLWTLELFLFVIWFWLLLSIFGDLIRDHDLSGGLKAIWIFALVPPRGCRCHLHRRARRGLAGPTCADPQCGPGPRWGGVILGRPMFTRLG
jgi:hypothetical protein